MGAELTRKRLSWGPEGACNDPLIRESYTQDGKLDKRTRDLMRRKCREECPVFKNCRAWAIVHSLDYFIAGMMPYEVAALRSNEIEKWGYEAYKWGWLEEPNLLTKAQLQKFAEQLKTERRRARQPVAALPSVFEQLVVPEFSL